MKRNVSMEEISDGKFYGLNDLVKAGCGDCKGCSACCRGMGNSIVLDPWDIDHLTKALGKNSALESLMAAGKVELNVVEGVILPNISMKQEACGFLNEEGRCTIHTYRPGICRLFPLGRYYENGSFSYFLQVHECRNTNRSKVKVKQWIDVENPAAYEEFICQWHYFLNDVVDLIAKKADENFTRQVDMYILQAFFVKGYDGVTEEEFYDEFKKRLSVAKLAIFGE
ncbi:MAG: YkgJ family cysteine cluster protein [Lachnospiraceae bacterium]